MKFVDASAPKQSPTRTPPVPDVSEPAPDPKKMHDEIIAEYRAKHGEPPDMEHVISEVFKRRGIKLPKRAFK
jgi:hypothetical protein